MGPIDVQQFLGGTVGDGGSHPLSERFATLAAAKAVFPFVTQLSQEIDWAVIQAAIWSAGTGGDPRGTTVMVPRGVYVCSDPLRISRQVRLTGLGRGVTQLSFASGIAGIIVDAPRTSLDGGYGSYATIANLDLLGDRDSGIQPWGPGREYAPPQRVWDRNDNRFFYQCLKAGRSRSAAPGWAVGVPRAPGDVIRASGPFHFQCTFASGDQTSGMSEPVWALPTDETTWDGGGAVSHEIPNYLHWKRILNPAAPPMPGVNRGTWTPGTIYHPGDIVQATADFTSGLFFRCEDSGPSGAEPAWEAAAPGEVSEDDAGLHWVRGVLLSKEPSLDLPFWKPETPYDLRTVIQVPSLNVLFECTAAGTSGTAPPAWNPNVGADSPPDGVPGPGAPPPVTWTCRADPSVFDDGDTTWACRAAPGIWLRTQAFVQNVGIEGFTTAGVHIQAVPFPLTNVNHWQLYNVAVYRCGLGVAVLGTDVQGGTAVGLELVGNGYNLTGEILPPGNGGTAVYDRGNGANVWIGCLTEANTGRAFVAATSNAASFVIGSYIEALQQPSYLGIGSFKFGSPEVDSPDSTGWIVDGSQRVGPFVVPNTRDPDLQLYLGYKSADPTILYAWRKLGLENWFVRWDAARQFWRTGAEKDGFPPASYFTGGAHPRGPYLQGLPSLLLGDPAQLAPQGAIQVTAFPGLPPWTGEPGDVVFNSSQPGPGDPDYGWAGWICVGPARVWKRFGQIEPDPP